MIESEHTKKHKNHQNPTGEGINMKHNRRNIIKTRFAAALCMFCAFSFLFGGMSVSAAEHTAYDNLRKEDAQTRETDFDMTNVTLSQTQAKGFLVPSYSYGKSIYYGNAEFDIKVNSPIVLNDEMYGVNLTCKSSNKNVRADASLSDNILHLQVHANKTCNATLTVSIAGKNFPISVSLKTVKISSASLLLEKGKTKKLKIKGCSKKIEWSSSNKKIATVNKKGVVKGKKIGNVVITAKIDGKPIGCAVSVTTGKLQKVCKRATYIGNHWQYSQAKRTQPGYYDCSSLVWKAYSEYAGLTFGNAGYPGTSATESAWCKANNRILKGGYTYKKVQKMRLNPGDLVFKSTDLRNPYNTTYHVEMFTGYTCLGYNSKGKPLITSLWASRSAGYGAADGSLLARPMK